MKQLFLPEDYTSVLDVWQTEHAIKFIKDTFQLALAAELKHLLSFLRGRA